MFPHAVRRRRRRKLRPKRISRLREVRKSGRIGDRRKPGGRPRATLASLDEVIRLAVRFLSQLDRTVAQVERFLQSRGVTSSHIEPAICRLTDLRYLDDLAYAQRWVEQRLATKPMGQERLKAELQAKGISDGLAERVLTEVFRRNGEEIVARREVVLCAGAIGTVNPRDIRDAADAAERNSTGAPQFGHSPLM